MNPLSTSEQGWSCHATKRARQKAITNSEARFIFPHGDWMKCVGLRTVAASVMSRTALESAADGTVLPASIPRLSRLVVLVGRDDGFMAMVAWLNGRKRRAYVRDTTIH